MSTGLTEYAYDDQSGRLESVVDPLGGTVSFHYNADGQLTRRSYPGTVVDTVTFTTEHRPHIRRVTGSPTFIADTLTYDHRGRVLTAPRSTMQYTGLGHLSEAVLTIPGNASTQWFNPDGLGQATAKKTWKTVGDMSPENWK